MSCRLFHRLLGAALTSIACTAPVLAQAIPLPPQQPAAPTPSPIKLPVSGSPFNYCSPSMTTQGWWQRCNLYLPNANAHTAPFRVVVAMDLGFFQTSILQSDIDPSRGTVRDRFFADCLDNGIAVVECQATVSDQPESNTVGAPAIHGRGMFYLPLMTLVPPFVPSAYEPYSSNDHHFAEKDAVMAVQYVKEESGNPASPFSLLDQTRMAVYGHSAAGFCMNWVALGPDRAAMTFPGSTHSQDLQDTTVQVAVIRGSATWVPAFNATVGIGGHLPQTFVASGTPDPTLPATNLGEVHPGWQGAVSAHSYTQSCPQIETIMGYADPHSTPMLGTGGPSCGYSGLSFSGLEIAANIHSRYSGLTWKLRFPGETHLILRDLGGGPAIPMGAYDEVIADPLARAARLAALLDTKL